MTVTVSIEVRKELVELAEKMVRYGIAKDISHAFNIMIERDLNEVLREVEFWDRVYEKVKELEEMNYKIRHGYLTRLLMEGRVR